MRNIRGPSRSQQYASVYHSPSAKNGAPGSMRRVVSASRPLLQYSISIRRPSVAASRTASRKGGDASSTTTSETPSACSSFAIAVASGPAGSEPGTASRVRPPASNARPSAAVSCNGAVKYGREPEVDGVAVVGDVDVVAGRVRRHPDHHDRARDRRRAVPPRCGSARRSPAWVRRGAWRATGSSRGRVRAGAARRSGSCLPRSRRGVPGRSGPAPPGWRRTALSSGVAHGRPVMPGSRRRGRRSPRRGPPGARRSARGRGSRARS